VTVRVCHLSSAHQGLDIRIYSKECVSLARAGFEVHLVISAVQAEVVSAAANGVTLHPVPAVQNRFARFFLKSWRTFRLALRTDAQIYHFHDPELLPYGVLLRILGKQVIYDVHEDLPRDILTKDWIPKKLRGIVAAGSRFVESVCARWFVDVVAATPAIREGFAGINRRAIVVNNYPILGELASDVGRGQRVDYVCYVGGIEPIRGARELVETAGLLRSDIRLALCGDFQDAELSETLAALPGWSRVESFGWKPRPFIRDIMSRSIAGLVTFLPAPNHLSAQPNKLFEYMSAGLPVVASHFPLWREIIEGNECGICVDPASPPEIARAIDYLAANPSAAERMGRNGLNAVRERYNWPNEEKTLLDFYQRLSGAREEVRHQARSG
jgi:glycosyltransferase involved in cell wall biosynthesis